MEFRRVSPRSSLTVSVVGFGCEPLGGADWGQVDLEGVKRAAAVAADSGINFFDTAGVYGLGASERNLRQALGSRIRDVVVSTKCGFSWRQSSDVERADVWRDASPDAIRRDTESSLKRLGLDCIPLLFVHWPDPKTPLEDTLEALVRLREQGKISEIGLSNYPVSQIEIAARNCPYLVAIQGQYSVLHREHERDVLPVCRREGLGFFAWGPLAQGLLTGKYGEATVFAAGDRRRTHPNFTLEERRRAAHFVKELAASGRGPAQAAVRWVIDQPGVTAAITGVKGEDQVSELLGVSR